MKFIGISCEGSINYFYLAREYVEAIGTRGVKPLLLPHIDDEQYMEEISNLLSGLLLAGGWDINPKIYGNKQSTKWVDSERDYFEIKLVRKFFEKKKPVFGICRGMQLLNISFGGTLHQDIREITTIKHWQRKPEDEPQHEIIIKPNTLLYRIMKTEKLMVNSFHHQAIRKPGEGLITSALSPDGIIEAIEHKDHPFMLGVQFHPEYMHDREPFSYLFDAFVEEVKCSKG